MYAKWPLCIRQLNLHWKYLYIASSKNRTVSNKKYKHLSLGQGVLFLLDPSSIIGYACHSLTPKLLFSKLDACEWCCVLSTFGKGHQTFTSWLLVPIFIGPESDHWLCLSLIHLLTDWLTNSRLVNLMPVNDAVCCLHLAKSVKLSSAGFTTNILSWQGKLLKHKLLCFDKIL